MSLEFIDLYKDVVNNTVLTPDRLWHLWVNARTRVGIEGAMAECGTFRGGSAYLLYKAVHGAKRLHVFDTFEGIPSEQRLDGEHSPGDFSCDYDTVKSFLSSCGGVILHKGLVPASLVAVRRETFNLVHLDMDLYEPTYEALKFFWNRMSVDGVIILDDWESLFGINDAVEKFASEQDKKIKYMKTTVMQCMLIKE